MCRKFLAEIVHIVCVTVSHRYFVLFFVSACSILSVTTRKILDLISTKSKIGILWCAPECVTNIDDYVIWKKSVKSEKNSVSSQQSTVVSIVVLVWNAFTRVVYASHDFLRRKNRTTNVSFIEKNPTTTKTVVEQTTYYTRTSHTSLDSVFCKHENQFLFVLVTQWNKCVALLLPLLIVLGAQVQNY